MKNNYKDSGCLNCQFPFSGNEKFCPECGQKNKGENLNVKDFILEVFAGFFSWDAKFWRTLVPLLFKPGKITKEYTQGKRVKFTNPFRFFFIISIVFFFLLKLSPKYEKAIDFNNSENVEKDSTYNSKATIFNKEIGNYISFQKRHPDIDISIALDSLHEENTFFNRLYYKKAKTINGFSENGNKSSKELIKKGFSYLSSTTLFLLPVFALFLKLLYIRKKTPYMNHLIFTFHIATFFFICLVLIQAISLIPFTQSILKNNIFMPIARIMVFGVYPFIAMKNFYQQGYLKTFFKLSLVFIIFSTLILIAITLMFMLAFFMM